MVIKTHHREIDVLVHLSMNSLSDRKSVINNDVGVDKIKA